MSICKEVDCKKRATYNIEGLKEGYCKTHMSNGMTNVRSHHCSHYGCRLQPNYNIEGQKQGLFCQTHRLDNMVNVTHKRCEHENCRTRPSYNTEDKTTPLYCRIHRSDNMVYVTNKRCEHENCRTRPYYNTEDETTPLYCRIHRLDNMVDVTNKRCKTHLCNTLVSNKQYEGYCLRCFVHTFPDKPVSRNYKTKEQATVDTVLEKFPDITWTCDKKVQDGCSLRRPDIQADFGSHIVIIEIDENHHSSYECSCENKRIMQLSQDFEHRPIVFIRFNPDGYTDINDKNITSCWGVNKLGILTIKKTKKNEWEERIHSLHVQIQYWIDNVPEKIIETVQLFY